MPDPRARGRTDSSGGPAICRPRTRPTAAVHPVTAPRSLKRSATGSSTEKVSGPSVPIPRCLPKPRYSAGSPAIRNFTVRSLSRASVRRRTQQQPSVTVTRYYFFGEGRTLQVVSEQDEGHDPAELQTGQNRTVQAHPHFPLHTFPLNVWPVATVATIGRSQGAIICASALGPQQTIPDNATAIWKENRDRCLDMAPPIASYPVPPSTKS